MKEETYFIDTNVIMYARGREHPYIENRFKVTSLRAALDWARGYLRRRGVESAALDAEVLLAHVTGLDRAGLYREGERTLTPREAEACRQLVERRAQREPVAYLTGKKEFMGLEFKVNRAVLIPRPETELLVERAWALARNLLLGRDGPAGPETELLIADVGTGSGAIAVSLAKFLPAARIYALDCSPAALEVARVNARRHGVAERIVFLQGDLLLPLFALNLTGKITLVVANLPYIPTGELRRLMPDVRCYEPLGALDGGPDGLVHYRRLLPQARRMLADCGYLLMETGPGQGKQLGRLLAEDGWQQELIPDLAGRERVILAVLKPPIKPLAAAATPF